jgi:hypothetical protein
MEVSVYKPSCIFRTRPCLTARRPSAGGCRAGAGELGGGHALAAFVLGSVIHSFAFKDSFFLVSSLS